MQAEVLLLLLDADRPQPQPRAPLPPFDMSGPYQVHTTLPPGLQVPGEPDLNFYRGNAWSVPVPSLPFIPQGTSSFHPERCLTWFLDQYVQVQPSIFDAIVDEQLVRGYSHFLMSRGGGFGVQSPQQYAQLAFEVKDAGGFYLCHMLTSKVQDPIGAPVDAYIHAVQPYVDALLTAGALDIACLGWELNLFWDPTALQAFKEWLRGYLPASIPIAAHFSTYVTAWQLPGHDRADFYNDGIVKMLLYQTDPWANLGTMQAHGYDALKDASGLRTNGVKLVAFEVKAEAQFDGSPIGNEHPNEDDGDMYNYGLLCTPGPYLFNGGYGNGARRPNGSWL